MELTRVTVTPGRAGCLRGRAPAASFLEAEAAAADAGP